MGEGEFEDSSTRTPEPADGDKTDAAAPRTFVIGVPFELESREAAHRAMDALLEAQVRRGRQ